MEVNVLVLPKASSSASSLSSRASPSNDDSPSVTRVGYLVSVYVGRRFKYRPRSGMKREFCTLFRVLRVETSGSDKISQ